MAQTGLNCQSFLNELQDRFDLLQNASSKLQITGTLTIEHPEPGTLSPSERTAVFRISYFASGERLRWGQTLIDKKGLLSPINFERVFVFGPGRDFVVQRLSGAQDYVVIQLGKVQESLRDGITLRRDLVIHAAHRIADWPARDMVRSSRFVITSLEHIVAANGSLLRMAFDYTSDLREQFNISGWVVLDPARHYAVREQDLRLTSSENPHVNYHVTGHTRYSEENTSGHPFIPEEVSFNQIDLNAKGNGMHLKFRLDSISNDPIPDSEFALGAFGLVDLDHRSRRNGKCEQRYSRPATRLRGFLADLIFKVLGRFPKGK